MNYTTNFNLNKPEGTDLYNHLTVDNPNMDTIDAAMQANKLASVGNATELVSGTVHAITRTDSDQNIFKFKATGDFKAGDTITVDGVSVNAYTTDGHQLLNDAYVLSAVVLCFLDNTSLWILSNKIPNSKEITYDNSTSNLTADNVQEAIDELSDFDETIFTNIVSLGTIGQNRITKKGKTAVCVLNTWGSGTYTTGQVIAKIPPSISPITYNYGICGYTINGVDYTSPIDIINGDVKAPAPGTYTKINLVTTILCH